ncbi:MAG TPA: UDP-N-acetylmuramate dehydrogenase [Gallionella sp.]|nr:UDP-N-acetylmuramate dehydrogenase [Gallionella sp.]
MTELQHLVTKPLRGKLSSNMPMRKYTSWRTGGNADRMYQPADLEDLLEFLRGLPDDEPVHAVGLGSNLLVRDGGLRGTVLLMHGTLSALHLELDGSIYAEAGVPGAKLARFAAKHGLQGAAFFAGIPGTLGGMLAMNAGCYGSETWEKVLRVQTVNRHGEVHVRSSADYEIGYRHVALRDTGEEWFVAAWLQFTRGKGESAWQDIKALLNRRIASQPLNQPNAGSVFRNPEGGHAAKLIELCGLKGVRLGGAQVSEKHANFIVNTGTATAADIENLILKIQAEVQIQTGIKLHPEVRIVGEKQP